MYHPEQQLSQYICPRHGISDCDECPHRESVDDQATREMMQAFANSRTERINAAVRLLVDEGYEVSHPVSLRPEENERPAGCPRFMELLKEMADVHIAKNAGYAGADNPDFFANFRDCESLGISAFMGCLVRMGDKWSRIKSLAKDPSNDRVGEAITDTLVDLANYALIAICLYEQMCESAEAKVEWDVAVEESRLYEGYQSDGIFKGILYGLPGVVRVTE